MVQPLVFLALFAPLLPDAGTGSALQWFVPGIISMTALMGASITGSNLTWRSTAAPSSGCSSPR